MVTIAHISDPHLGSQYFVPNLMNRVIVELNEMAPDAVVVSGDLTTTRAAIGLMREGEGRANVGQED